MLPLKETEEYTGTPCMSVFVCVCVLQPVNTYSKIKIWNKMAQMDIIPETDIISVLVYICTYFWMKPGTSDII